MIPGGGHIPFLPCSCEYELVSLKEVVLWSLISDYKLKGPLPCILCAQSYHPLFQCPCRECVDISVSWTRYNMAHTSPAIHGAMLAVVQAVVVVGVAASASASTTSLPGCYLDSRSARQLGHQVCLVDGGCATLTREWCAQQCRAEGFTVAGVSCRLPCTHHIEA